MLRLTLILLGGLAFSASVNAATLTCGKEVRNTGSRVSADATCPHCTDVNQFAVFGAMVLENHNAWAANSRGIDTYRFLDVYNPQGAMVTVIVEPRVDPTNLSFSIFGWSYQINTRSRADVRVTATPVRGSVRGSPWNQQITSKVSLSNQCQRHEESKKNREAKDFYKDQLKLGVINFGSFTVGGELNAFSKSAFNRFSTFSSSGLSPHGFPVITTESVF
ncbi:MAG: hypothetical protein ACI883_001379 [Candidatus Azotimanducaceae bacterium]|jgi:hypothetical protein|tara:strand:- start:57 stop:716 length:660 start_codon:yes stop_codon:yes gene_type:complete